VLHEEVVRARQDYVALTVLAVAFAARADVVWPALFMEMRLLSVWVVVLGLAIEPVIRYLTRRPWWTSLGITVAINAISTLVGVLLIPLAGIVWEVGPGLLMYRALGVGTFNPVTWTATVVLAALISASVEALALRWPFRHRIGRRGFGVLTLANLASTVVAAASLAIWPAEH
jgi:hypothetical protein